MGKGRYAPSPSGRMHLGNFYSALLSWLSARAHGNEFSLRLEDLDTRCKNAEYSVLVREDLSWLGIDWDEELVQTQRIGAYDDAFEMLSESAHVYPCFCTRADLHAASAPHASDGTPIYAGTCRALSSIEQAERAGERKPAFRIEVPDEVVTFKDGHLGMVSQSLVEECGDFVLRRSDGIYAYQLVCVVDDAASGCTEVVRGDDLLSSTPRQLFLYEQLGLQVPSFYHHPLLNAPDGRRLSKRDKDLHAGVLRESYGSPEELVGELAVMAGLLEEPEGCRAEELIELFDWAKVPKEGIAVDQEKFVK